MSALVIVFAREPIRGQVKTRLAVELGSARALDLYLKMLSATLRRVARYARIRNLRVQCHVASLDPLGALATRARTLGIELRAQCGGGLGERMRMALEQGLRETGSVVLLGSDCPEMRAHDIDAAFAALRGSAAVIAPSPDGGYVLVGVRERCDALFEEVDWGTDRVTEQTRRNARRARISLAELRSIPDVDHALDVDRWLGRVEPRVGAAR